MTDTQRPRPPDPHLDPASRHPERAERAIAVSFVIATVGGLALAVTYWLGGQTQTEGALLFVCLGALGFGITLWGKDLMAQGPFVQDRENLIGTEEDKRAFKEAFVRGEESFDRRRFLLRLLLGGVGALGVALIFPIRSLGPNPRRTLFQTQWRKGSRMVRGDGSPVRVTDLAVGGVLTVFPEGAIGSSDSQTLLLRPATTPTVTRRGRENWSPAGYLAFSKVCTHAGCPVGLYEQDRKQLLCPCHQSTFDVLQGCQPSFGPATRALPQLQIMVDESGYVRAVDDFAEPIGPGFWNRGRTKG
jgi:ubiquinol-cytochrome c reductase iron-sulfur subunit